MKRYTIGFCMFAFSLFQITPGASFGDDCPVISEQERDDVRELAEAYANGLLTDEEFLEAVNAIAPPECIGVPVGGSSGEN